MAERGALRAYLAGRTFGEFDRWLFVEETAPGWRVAATAPFDFFAPTLDPPWPDRGTAGP